MVVNCLTKYNGVYYPTGSDVPVGNTVVSENKTEEKPVVEVKEEVSNTENPEMLTKRGRRKKIKE